ncbi:hypothetical protein SELR_01940 [Selenomonas ruminantium subsp. lactilytica TAM6421]|uniref:Hydrolase n=1 Tax=Selenomonas ruminantium subsp. lactilytica (strain NBRC 103574 / TAM6421) TaxID=927704 RepID=I0GMB5_SELRL|nr:HAD family hydrolase [Selenomonas ruminantium]BAL81902.1 hypothetical protein SELR_01940 [Selenomonas ruminantium subsp. lactilytica TAM6421]
MSNKKIIFLDVDGTLVDYDNVLPESAVEAIRQARQNGHRVYISTGRSRAEVYQHIWDIGLDGMIGGNGSYVEDNGQAIMHQVLSAADSHHIVDWLHERGLEFFLESNNGLFASENFETAGEPLMQEYAYRKGQENARHLTVRDCFPEMIFGGELYRDDLNKISFILKSYQDFLAAKQEFAHLKLGTWGGAGEKALFGDIGPAGVSKDHAIDVLLKHIGADKADTIAFGDAKIDIPMFAYCARSVCMGNGGDEAKAAADLITDAVAEDGIYHAFQRLQLI